MRTSPLPLLAITLLLAGATASAQSRSANEVRDIRAARLAQNAAMAAGDVDRAARWWTEDVTIRRGLGGLSFESNGAETSGDAMSQAASANFSKRVVVEKDMSCRNARRLL